MSNKINKICFVLILSTIILIELQLPSWAMIKFYVDPDWAGSTTGNPATPWTVLNSSAWTVINNALATDDVTIYFSAREANSDTAENYGNGVDLTNKTADPGHTLTLDGNYYYNTNDSSPNWIVYTGSKRCQVGYITSQNSSHKKFNDVTIQGFYIERTSGKAVGICGDNYTVQNCEITHRIGASSGPLVLIVPSADGPHNGSSAWCPQMDNINILNNVIHDSYGELIYVGGAGCAPSDPTGESSCNGFPSHNNVTISGNTLYNGGTRGAEGDGIDIKAGLTNLTISQNEIYNLNNGQVRAIVTQGQKTSGANQNNVFERNYIHDCSSIWEAAITLANSWGTPKGVEIRNNIIDTNTSISKAGNGIHVYAGTGITIYNNTIYNNKGRGISVNATATIKNNLLIGNNSGGDQVSWSGTITESNQGYSNTFGETCTSCTQVDNTDVVDAGNGNFKLPEGSRAIDKGVSLSSFSNDFVGTPRGQISGWDIGAYEYTVAPLPPGSFRFQ